jgi:hypothetical protein
MKVKDLVNRSKEGTVTPVELAEVAALLSAGVGGENTYQLLYVLGRSGATSYEPLVASFLDHRDNPMVARLALQTLTSFWSLGDRYTADLERFLDGADWDEFGEVRGIAISATGGYLATNVNCGLLDRLLRLAAPTHPESQERRIAVRALATALGDPLNAPVDAGAVLERARQRYEAECQVDR